MGDYRSCFLMRGVCIVLAASFLASVGAEVAAVEAPVELQGSVDPEPRQDRRYYQQAVVFTSGRRYNLHDIAENRHRPTINTHLFPQLAINYDLEWIHPHHQHQPHRPHRPDHHPEHNPDHHTDHHHNHHPDHHPDHHTDHHHNHHPDHNPGNNHPQNPSKITRTVTKTVTKGPTVFWTEFVPYCSLDQSLPSKCSVASTATTLTTTDTSRVLHIREETYTYQDAYCLTVVPSTTTQTSTIDKTTTVTPVTTVTVTVGNHLTKTNTVIVPTTVVTTESTTTTVYERSTAEQDCNQYYSITTVPFPGPTTTIFETYTETETNTYTVNDLATCTNAVTETRALAPTLTLTVLPYMQTLTKTTTTLTTDLACSSRLYLITETYPATVTKIINEATFVIQLYTSTGDPNFVCPNTVTVTTTNAVPQVTTTSRDATLMIPGSIVMTAFELQEFYWCGADRTTSTEVLTIKETATRLVTVGVTSTKLVPVPACMVGHGLPNHGCPQEFLMAVKLIMIEMTEIFIDLRAYLHDILPHVDDRQRDIIERFNSLPLQEILGHLPLKEQREEALWSQKQLQELKDIVSDDRTMKDNPNRLFEKIKLVVTRLERIKRSLVKRH